MGEQSVHKGTVEASKISRLGADKCKVRGELVVTRRGGELGEKRQQRKGREKEAQLIADIQEENKKRGEKRVIARRAGKDHKD